jgi:hypothetical protein
MEAGVSLKVVGYGAIPLAMGLGGIYLAVDSVRSRLKRGMLGLFFAVLTVVGVAVVYFVENNAALDHRIELDDGKKANQPIQSQPLDTTGNEDVARKGTTLLIFL